MTKHKKEEKAYFKLIPKPDHVDVVDSDWVTDLTQISPTILPTHRPHPGSHVGDRAEYYIVPVNFDYPHTPGGGGIGLSDPPPKTK